LIHHTNSTTSQIIKILEDWGCWFETFEHGPVRTSEEAAKVRSGYSLKQGAKAMLVKVKLRTNETKYMMLVLPGDLRFDKAKVKQLYDAKDFGMATEDEVREITKGVEPGGVPPFGNLFNIEIIADPKLFENEKIIFNAGSKSFSIAMMSSDYKDIVNPKILPISLN
jgi:prolyl-tRNA editing enzyme YbaK/EbsC (Cys-tRNA(Pro) deacylase)